MTHPLKITVGLDSEPASRRAVDWAIRQAVTQPSQITLLTAADPVKASSRDQQAQLETERARIEASAPGTPVETALVEGPIDDILSRSARHSDLLVIGSPRTRHRRSVLAGDVAARVARHPRCPVVIVPDDWEFRDGAVVVGLEDDSSSDSALRRAAAFARASGQELRILHAWMRPAPPSDPGNLYLKLPEDLHDVHRGHLTQAAYALRQRFPELTVREDLYEGRASNGLLALAATAELVVIGSHRRGAIAGFLLGSVGRDLLHYCTTPLCVVPSKNEVPASAPGEPAGDVIG